jgi:large subunit ribosomal protein L7/L12
MADLEKIVEQLSGLSVLEAAELVKKLEEKWGVSAAAPVAVAAVGGAPAAAAEAVEEKTEFDVVIKDAGPKKIEVIKVIRQLVNLSLARSWLQSARMPPWMPRRSWKKPALSSKSNNTKVVPKKATLY